jgi:predicted extracellular nuclease
LAALALAALVSPVAAEVVISQVYGGGGNSGATLRNDFIELKNIGATAVAVGGWSVQYASATGSSWQVTPLPAGLSIPAGGYLLIQQAAGVGGSQDLPTPDVVGGIPMAATAGKVALVNSATALSGTCPLGAAVRSFVGYGSNASCSEGSPVAALTNATAAVRGLGGCLSTGNNATDFSVLSPVPRNSASPAVVCEGGGGGGPLAAAIYEIQGSGPRSPLEGQTVVTAGVVTRINSNGFFIQDLLGDGDPATSDGLFVFTGSNSFGVVTLGNLVQVTGVVTEFAPGAGTAATPLTQIANPSSVTLQGTGYSIAPVDVALPIAPGDTLERFENMLVRITTPLTVQDNGLQARFGLLTLAAGGRQQTPTNVHRPLSPAALALEELQSRSFILLDDGTTLQNPNPTPYLGPNGMPRVGDSVSGLVGVLDFGLSTASSAGPGLYRLHPIEEMTFAAANPRPATPPAVGGNLRVATMNVLNYFTTFTDGNTADGQSGQGCSLGATVTAGNCRGANNLAEFQRQQIKIVRALAALDADAIGLVEIQNNGLVAVNNLVTALNAFIGAPAWAAAGVPAFTGTDAVQQAIIYRPARLTPVGATLSDADPVHNRPPVAQTFQAPNGERLALVVNHLRSKGSCPAPGSGPDADQGDGQSCFNARRVAQMERTLQWVATVRASTGVQDVMLMGDINAYGQEDPIVAATSQGWVDTLGQFDTAAYTYVFQGLSGRLDHALASATLAPKVTGAFAWAINADEQTANDYNLEFKQPACATCAPDPFDPSHPFRSSDHDPALVGLAIYKRITGTLTRDRKVGTPGDDQFIASPGADLLVANGGADLFVYTALAQAKDTIIGFAPGASRLDLRGLLASLGWTGTDPVAEGWLRLVAARGGTAVEVNPSPSRSGRAGFQLLVLLADVSPAAIVPARDFIVR